MPLSRRHAMTVAALALVMPSHTGAAATTQDPIFEAIARATAARQRWNAAIEPSPEWYAADRAIDQAQDALFVLTPTTLGGILALIDYTRREDYDPEVALLVIEQAITRMVDCT